MSVVIDGTTGISGNDGSAATPALRGDDANTGMFFPAADTVAVATDGSERMRVNSSGNVGVGTSSPSVQLENSLSSNNTTKTTSTNNNTRAGFLCSAKTPAGVEVQTWIRSEGDAGTGVIFTQSNHRLGFSTNNAAPQMILDTSGNLLVGTTSQSNSATLTVSGTVSASLNGRIYSLGTYNNTTANAGNLHVASDGHFFRSTSSLKYKRDVQNATHGLTELLALRPVTYKGQAQSDGDTVYGGLIAEEVHEAGLTEFVQYAEDGTPDALAYGNMVSLCIKAIQELKAEVDSLKAQLETS